MTSFAESMICLAFPVDVEDGWPPVAVESLPFRVVSGGFVALNPPVFVKGLSAGDVIDATFDVGTYRVIGWTHVAKSRNTTVWLLRMRQSASLNAVLGELRELGCGTVRLEEFGSYSVDVPESVPIEAVDAALAHLDTNSVAVAFPSFRHGQDPDRG